MTRHKVIVKPCLTHHYWFYTYSYIIPNFLGFFYLSLYQNVYSRWWKEVLNNQPTKIWCNWSTIVLSVNQLGQEEYIWAMRTSAYRESDSELWKERRSTPLTSQSQIKKDKSMHYTTDDHQTKVMASLVPDEVIYNVNDYAHRHYDACFLFGDVSGIVTILHNIYI